MSSAAPSPRPAALPIDALLPDVLARLRSDGCIVLQAPPGAGKTTRVPAAILDAGLAGGRQVVVLEPRRIAARAAAQFVAAARGTAAGGEVGYQVRFDRAGTAQTRLWFITEGVLGRRLARDPFLEAVGVLVLDEFHERHVAGDVALAVARELRATVRSDLRLVVMSATLDAAPVARYLGNCPVLTATGRAHPVTVTHAAAPDDRPLAGRVVTALQSLLAAPDDDGGDILVFLPGAADIRRCLAAAAGLAGQHALDLVPLHGELPLDAQERAIRRGPRRRVVFATNVAETALTVEGVTAVIDSGLARSARFDPRRGINVLRVAPISRAAATQRAGRAGRVAPGRCLRLWTAAEHATRRDHESPEITRLDLSATVLELRAWGLRDLSSLAWLDPPPPAALAQADHLLRLLGAVAPDGSLTPAGRRMLALAVPPRLARLLVEAEARGCAADGALIAALAAERDILLGHRPFAGRPARESAPHPPGPSDLLLRRDLFLTAARAGFDPGVCRQIGLDSAAVRAVARARQQLRRGAPAGTDTADADTLLRCILAGFPDRLVRRRAAGSPRGVMVGGTGVVLDDASVVREAPLFVAVEVEAAPGHERAEARVRLASAVERAWLAEMFPAALREREDLLFLAEQGRVVARRRTTFHDLVLEERLDPPADRTAAGRLLAAAVREDPGRAGGLDARAQALLERIAFLGAAMPETGLPADPAPLLADALADLCAGRTSLAELRAADVGAAIRERLTPAQRAALAAHAPADYVLPNGRRAAIVYARHRPPLVAARLQELFGLTATPRLAAGRVPLAVQILAPNQRPVQITDDLAGFWQRTYAEVRRQLRGRYPRHAWPEDPLNALPAGTRSRR